MKGYLFIMHFSDEETIGYRFDTRSEPLPIEKVRELVDLGIANGLITTSHDEDDPYSDTMKIYIWNNWFYGTQDIAESLEVLYRECDEAEYWMYISYLNENLE